MFWCALLLCAFTATAALFPTLGRLEARPVHVPLPLQGERQAEGASLAGLTVAIDPGHGGYDGGARARDSGIWEKELNLSISLALRDQLLARGAAVLMTRSEDVDLCGDASAGGGKKRRDLSARLRLAQEGQAQLLLSIHLNEYRSRKVSGPQVFYTKGQDASRMLAGAIQAAMIAELSPEKERTALPGDYFMLSLPIPSVLVECGFLSNPREERLLLTPAYRERIAQAIAQGVADYWALQSRLNPETKGDESPPVE